MTLRPKTGSSEGNSIFGLQTLVEFDWQVAVAGGTLTPREFETLVNLKTPLVQVRGQWVELHAGEIEKAVGYLKHMRELSRRGGGNGSNAMTLQEAIRLSTGQMALETSLPITSVRAEGDLQAILDAFGGGGPVISPANPPDAFHGTLRPYQVTGVAWLRFLTKYGFGACLADDMGLGKTIEVIAFLLHERSGATCAPLPKSAGVKPSRRRSGRPGGRTAAKARTTRGPPEGETPALIICPMSVVGNWRNEIARFAPSLRVFVHHGGERPPAGAFQREINGQDVVITTYATALRDHAILSMICWRHLILDEAQNIKNYHAKQTQAIRSLECGSKIALTGTPVENRLAELWSILDFLNQGYLGAYETFRRQFVLPVEKYRDPSRADLLRTVVRPFVLRRLKTDKSIIQDLPEKIEANVWCPLTQEQASLYEAVVKDMMAQIDSAQGIQRKGLVLASLVKFKQVCDHPALFLHDGSPIGSRSGKLARLEEMLREVLEAREKALVFTQFSEMGALLRNHLEQTLHVEVLFLNGQTPQKQRERMVERFQQETYGAPIFVISLKAGGLGLNLTAASHVFHFDRWWNPAVENQATDRAFRIGQRKNVQVHKFLCGGTLEEKIAEMLEMKKDLAEKIITQGESWITELDSAGLREIFQLTRNVVIASEMG